MIQNGVFFDKTKRYLKLFSRVSRQNALCDILRISGKISGRYILREKRTVFAKKMVFLRKLPPQRTLVQTLSDFSRK